MSKLPAEFKAQWVEALRSGRYRQGRHALRDRHDKYCCLGVACEITGTGWFEHTFSSGVLGYVTTNHGMEYPTPNDLPPEVYEVLASSHSCSNGYDSVMNWLATKNDAGVSFDKIADLIEEYL